MSQHELIPEAEAERRMRALIEAWDLVDERSKPPLNPKGYPVDGWKPMDFPARVRAVKELASFILNETNEETS